MLSKTEFGGQGLRVYFIHGLASDAQGWIANTPVVTEHAQAIGIDLPGHGKSSDVPVPDKLQQVADQVVECIDTDEPCILIGHSAGGAIAMMCAARVPVKGLNLIAPVGLGTGADRHFFNQLLAVQTEPQALAILQTMFVNKRLVSKVAARRLLLALQSGNGRERWGRFARMLISSSTELDAAIDHLSQLRIPVQIYWGRNDLINPLCEADRRRFPADWQVIDRCGHLPQIEHLHGYNDGLVKLIQIGS